MLLERYGAESMLIGGYVVMDPETADSGDERYYWTRLGIEVVNEFWTNFFEQVTGPVEGQ